MPKTNEVEKAPQKKTATQKPKTVAQATPVATAAVGKAKTKQVTNAAPQVNDEFKEKKPGRYEGVDKGDAPNKATAFAGLHLNVEYMKTYLRKYYNDNYKVEKKVKLTPVTAGEGEKTPAKKGAKVEPVSLQDASRPKTIQSKVMISDAHFAVSAIEHTLCLNLVGMAYSKSKKAGAGLHTLSESDLMTALQLDHDYSYTFTRMLSGYFPKMDYVKQLNYSEADLVSYIEKFGFNGGNTNVNISGVINLISFLLLQNRNLLAENAYWATVSAKKTTVTDRTILYTIPTVYQGQLKDVLFKKCEDVMLKISGLKPENDGSETGSKKGSKKAQAEETNQDAEDEEVEDEEADEDEEEAEEEADEEADEDEEEEPVPTPPKKGAKANASSGNAKKK